MDEKIQDGISHISTVVCLCSCYCFSILRTLLPSASATCIVYIPDASMFVLRRRVLLPAVATHWRCNTILPLASASFNTRLRLVALTRFSIASLCTGFCNRPKCSRLSVKYYRLYARGMAIASSIYLPQPVVVNAWCRC